MLSGVSFLELLTDETRTALIGKYDGQKQSQKCEIGVIVRVIFILIFSNFLMLSRVTMHNMHWNNEWISWMLGRFMLLMMDFMGCVADELAQHENWKPYCQVTGVELCGEVAGLFGWYWALELFLQVICTALRRTLWSRVFMLFVWQRW